MSQRMNPQMATVIEELEDNGIPDWHSMSIPCARRIEDEVFSRGAGIDLDLVRDFEIEGDEAAIPIRVYRPEAEHPPVLVFCHGGGWTLGTLDSADNICRELASRTGCLVISVDYRLAPEHPFPAALNDVSTALQWAAEYADKLGADSSSIGVAGTSAGGNLAAAAALRARETGPSLSGQFLLYPITGTVRETESYVQHSDQPLLTRRDMEWFWDQYLDDPVHKRNPLAAVRRASDLSGVAPAVVLTAGLDVLRDDGVEYVDQLEANGVPTTHDHYPSLAHGFLSLTDEVDTADEAMSRLADHIQSRLSASPQKE
ncbi:alpha/beta hydrolase [Natrinema sp. 1APR25-10V2]|uniref:alpha/beta hydrolase n=1 Tax=Natrinema sp. 1APR25-10V2 TaxID=2951081 RepID=UPI002876A331|nr:alpha/beta hydrolase [Natrinema sp. 1APR25-10V2]MDS0477298.1 alpha/beta hydrolase [Natrinema sp. 1APR25-10V2]